MSGLIYDAIMEIEASITSLHFTTTFFELCCLRAAMKYFSFYFYLHFFIAAFLEM
jgi:hypothetical protein